jgi:hypothetical protein
MGWRQVTAHRHREQVATTVTTVEKIMRSAAFKRGVQDKREGRPPSDADDWDYERGRQWAAIAPADMPVTIDGRLNPKAKRLFWQEPIL